MSTETRSRIRKAQNTIMAARRTHNVIAVDPYGCGCTECIVGEYVPLEQATDGQVIAMVLGELLNNTGFELYEFEIKDDGIVVKPPRPKEEL